jgi:hypothetical protein
VRENEAIYSNNQLITRFSKVEYLQLKESRDPEGKTLVILTMFYGDGRELLIHEVYDERTAGNLANAISTVIHCDVRWR